MAKNCYRLLFSLPLVLLMSSVGLIAGTFTIINETNLGIEVRHISIVCALYSKTYETDLDEFKDGPLIGKGRVQANWSDCFFGEQYGGRPPAFRVDFILNDGASSRSFERIYKPEVSAQNANTMTVLDTFEYGGETIFILMKTGRFFENNSVVSSVKEGFAQGISAGLWDPKPKHEDYYYYYEDVTITISTSGMQTLSPAKVSAESK